MTHLVTLVGSNPLPAFLTAATLCPNSVTLIHSWETEQPMWRLHTELSARLSISDVRACLITDPYDAETVRQTTQEVLDERSHLDYTGGTKIMAAHARRALAQVASRDGDARASYVDERNQRLRFDDGHGRQLEPIIDLKLLLKLHGVDLRKPDAAVQGEPTVADARAWAACVLDDPTVANEVYDALNRARVKEKDLKKSPFNVAAHCAELGVETVPGQGGQWTNRLIRRWQTFLTGGWLEVFVADILKRARPAATVEVSVVGRRHGRELEVDVAVLEGHRLHVISCTTDRTVSVCKSKGFEVALRASQLGGDLARSAVVCLLDGVDPQGGSPKVDLVRGDFADLWEEANTPQVFGLEDLRAWLVGDPATLTDWLDGKGS